MINRITVRDVGPLFREVVWANNPSLGLRLVKIIAETSMETAELLDGNTDELLQAGKIVYRKAVDQQGRETRVGLFVSESGTEIIFSESVLQ